GSETEADADDARITAAEIGFIFGALILSRNVDVRTGCKFQAAAITHTFHREARTTDVDAGVCVADLGEGEDLRGDNITQTHRSSEVAADFDAAFTGGGVAEGHFGAEGHAGSERQVIAGGHAIAEAIFTVELVIAHGHAGARTREGRGFLSESRRRHGKSGSSSGCENHSLHKTLILWKRQHCRNDNSRHVFM